MSTTIFFKKYAKTHFVRALLSLSCVLVVSTVGCSSVDTPVANSRFPSSQSATTRMDSVAESSRLSAAYVAAAEDPVRTVEDRRSDASRKPVEFLKFAGLAPSMKVLDIAASGGNTSQLMALVVGEGGMVYAQGPQIRPVLQKRLNDRPQQNLRPIASPFDAPVSPDMPKLDLITINLNYHDIANLPIDRIKMNRALYDALRAGGHVVVIDHAATPGSGAMDTSTLHRIDENLVQAEFERVGFLLEESSTYLRNPADNHKAKSSSMEGSTDKFALRFVRPGL